MNSGYHSYLIALNLGDSASKCVASALTHGLMTAVPHSMFQVLVNTLLNGMFQKYLPIFFVGRKTELCSTSSLFISAKFLTILFILPLPDMLHCTREETDCRWHICFATCTRTLNFNSDGFDKNWCIGCNSVCSALSLPLLNRGSQNDVLIVMTMLQTRRAVLIPGRGKRLFLQNVHMGSGNHQASYSLGIGKWRGGEVKFTLEQVMQAQRGSCDIAVLFL